MTDVIVDTSAWIASFRSTAQPVLLKTMKELIGGGCILVPGIIQAELLRGAKNAKEVQSLHSVLSSQKYLRVEESFWQRLGYFANQLFLQGINVPLPDAYIALLAMENDVELLHYDRHFDLIAGKTKLKVFKLPG
jgi:predicted nucleic acid-binding protein